MTTPALASIQTPGPADAATLVLGPALGTTAESVWGPAAPLLAERFSLLRWDLPGHGRSQPAQGPFTIADLADAVVREADAAGLGRFAYAGVSIGGAVGLELALRHPDRLLGMVAVCSGAKFGTEEAWHDRARQVRRDGTASLVEATVPRWFAPSFTETQPAVSGALLESLARTSDADYAFCCEALAGYDLRDQLAAITAPVLVIAAELDHVSTPADAEAIARAVQHGEFALVPDASHLAPAERPDDVAELLIGFLGKHS